MKKYVIIAGVNGAGKTTLYQTSDDLLKMERVNSDEIIKSFGDWKNREDEIKAGKIAVRKISEYFNSGRSFNQETTLCGKSIFRNIRKAKELGYIIELHYIGVDSADIAKKRVAYRVERGGHGIPPEDIERRYHESLANLNKVIMLSDLAVLYDNTSKFKRFAIYTKGKLTFLSSDIPRWFSIDKTDTVK